MALEPQETRDRASTTAELARLRYLSYVLSKFRHQTILGRRVQRTPAPLQERNPLMDQLMHKLHESARFAFDAACEAEAEGTRKTQASAQ